ncbi:MAG TPA: mechanosensitive ion channel family protein [Ktedonobacteraceae bacterium]|jgi:small-conductance mechanosensitive channel|nr:mechanosensitive ion channel family protein [Ktedonobacteraceae bacterium]
MSLLTNSISLLGAGTPTATATTGTAIPTPTLTATNLSLQKVQEATKGTVDTTLNIILSSGSVLVALALGLLLRQICVRYLKKTVLDNWAVQTLGILVIIPPLIIGAIVALAIWNNLFSLIQDLKASHIDVYLIGLNFAETLILIALSIGLARTVRKLAIRGLGDHRLNINTQTLLGRIVYITVLTITSFCILSIWQVPVGIPVAAVGVVTIVITIAFQDILKDLVAGFYLLLSKPFFIGDQISMTIAPTVYVGKVQNVELRATKLRLISGEEVTIPNAIVFTSTVINNTYFEERRATIAVTVSVADFVPQETANQIRHALKDIKTIIQKPEPTVTFSSLANGKVTLLSCFWVPSNQIIDISDAMYALHTLLPNAELAIREPAGMA